MSGRLWEWGRHGASWVLDFLFPSHCELCGEGLKNGRGLCGGCEVGLPRVEPPFCQRCGEPFDGKFPEDQGPETCPNCHDLRYAFDFARPVLHARDGARQLIHGLKYKRRIHLGAELGRVAAAAFDDPRLAIAKAERWPVVPVPLHHARLFRRHFNQAEEIACGLEKACGLPMVRALARVRATSTQTRLGRRKRLENLRGCFEVTRAGRKLLESRPTGLILLDDVLTTGATAHECARTLRRAGAEKVIVVTVARG